MSTSLCLNSSKFTSSLPQARRIKNEYVLVEAFAITLRVYTLTRNAPYSGQRCKKCNIELNFLPSCCNAYHDSCECSTATSFFFLISWYAILKQKCLFLITCFCQHFSEQAYLLNFFVILFIVKLQLFPLKRTIFHTSTGNQIIWHQYLNKNPTAQSKYLQLRLY